MSSLPSDAPAPRLCIIVKWPYFEGYGFNLHAEKSKPGQYIGKVDENSPAEKAGLLEDDRIIEVNGVNIANENHKQVVQRIKAVPNETRLLVVDPAADRYYKNRNIVVRGSQDNVITRSSVLEEKAPPTPETQTVSPPTSVSNGHHEEIDNRSVSSAASSSAASEASTQPQSPMSTSPTPPPSLESAPEPVRSSPQATLNSTAATTTTTTKTSITNNASPKSQPVSNNNTYNSSGLNLNMSAAEMRAMLARKKKADPRKETVDLKTKYEIIQNM
uniref:PDZ domain-containing protein n=1 Tax=Scylla olivacea TaxID=85551 RepID=A0A0N7ZBN2_SCYOL